MQGFWGQTFYGNTVMDWGIALAIALVAVVLGKIIYWIFGNVLRRITAKTDTKLDDIILRILRDFNTAGLEFAFPTQTILAEVEQKTA